MIRRIILTTVLVAATAIAAFAHEGHVHKVRGTISQIEKNSVQVQATDGKKVVVLLNDKTQILRGPAKADFVDLKAGIRVVIDAEGEPLVAKILRLGAAPATKKP